VQNYQRTVSQLVNYFGDENTAANYLSKCIYTIGLGSNDYLNNYFMPTIYSTSRQFTPQQYANVLLQAYAQQLKVRLFFYVYDLGSVNIGVTLNINRYNELI